MSAANGELQEGYMQETPHPEMPMTMAGEGVPSLMMHQFLRSALRRASSSRSCCKMGRPLSLSKLQVARLSRHPDARYSICKCQNTRKMSNRPCIMPIYSPGPASGFP